MTRGRRLALLVVMAFFVLWVIVRWANSRTSPAHTPGISEGKLADCDDRPNCVSTQAESEVHEIEPIRLDRPADGALQRLIEIIVSMSRSRVITSRDDYLHIEFRSALWGFVDDVEFRIDDSDKLIHFRSASRVGRSDLGVNRKRMEEIRRKYHAHSSE